MITATSTAKVVTELQSAGLVLTLIPDRGLGVTPKALLTEPLRALIKTHRDELVRWLRMDASNDELNIKLLEPQPAPAMVTSMVSTVDTVCEVNNPLVNSPVNKEIADWNDFDRAYQTHHFNCPTCIVAGKGYGRRCDTGAPLWSGYDGQPVQQRTSALEPASTPPRPAIHPSLLTAANEVEIHSMIVRLALFAGRGLSDDEADALTDKLLVRDREGDRRGACAECRHLLGHGPGRWRCGDRSPVNMNELADANLGAFFVHKKLNHCNSSERTT